ncbi:MAG: hypothetical protein NC401_16805 [Ruminococcus sp.]|nr:hypothetical protein [Ruminococcus sp.]
MLIKSKSDEQKREEVRIMHDFHGDPKSTIHREAAEAIARYTREQVKELNSKEERYCR